MDFIERFFGLSPDNGDGSTELLWCVALALLLVGAFWLHQRRRRRVDRLWFRRRR